MDELFNDILKVAKEVESIEKEMSEDLKKISSTLSSNKHMFKQSSKKVEAKLINTGDFVICVDNFQPLFKGRRYLVSDNSIPGFLRIKEIQGEDVGIFAINRFVLDNNEQ